MKAVIHVGHHEHHQIYGRAMQAGLEAHGIEVRIAGFDQPEPADFAVVWGVRQRRVFAAGIPVLVMERGHVGDRLTWTSCGWGGLGRRAHYAAPADRGERWSTHFGHLMQRWRTDFGYALIIGQVENDASIEGLDVFQWAEATARDLEALAWDVRFRPHPLAPRRPQPRIAIARGTTLAQDLAGAGLCVTWNSTAGVEAVLAGVPTVTFDEGAMAWPVSAHHLQTTRPPRWEWATRLAWCQFTIDEIRAGIAWEHLALEVSA